MVSFAYDRADLPVAIYCADKAKCAPQIKEYVDRARFICKIEVEGLKCDELQKAHPEWAPLMRRCDLPSMCQEVKDLQRESALACMRGYKNAMVDLGISIKDMAVGLSDFVDTSWDGFKKNVKLKNEFISECNKSLVCKRDLVKDDHRYRQMTDEQIQKYSAAFLYVQAQSMKGHMASVDRLAHRAPAPRSAASDEEHLKLTPEQNEKLQSMYGMISDKVKSEYNRYSCYHPVAQEELKCYAIATVVDPTLVAGYFLKGARAITAASRLEKSEDFGLALKAGSSGLRNRAELVKKYLEFSPTTVAQNERWIVLAEKGRGSKAVFFDVENSQIKVLNDSLKDKNLVTSLTNFHKDILAKKMDLLEAKYPDLVIEKYSDFKSMRYAFSGKVPADLEKQLQKIFKDTNLEFDDYLKNNGIVRGSDPAKDWFRGGVGETADQANLASRYSRQMERNEVRAFSQADLQKNMNAKLQTVEQDRIELRGYFANTGVVDGATLHPDAFDIVRKSKGDPRVISQELANRFGLKSISDRSVATLQRYAKETDEFSPGLYIAKRESAHLNEAVHGGLSADIIGLGSANLKGTAEALANSGSIDKALVATRLAEKAVTQNFVQQKKVFEDVVKKAVPPGKLKTICSGDDCVSVATAPLAEIEKLKILKGLSETRYSGNYRLAFVPDGVKDIDARNALANHGEAIEKILRKSLSARMEPAKLKGLTFGVDMRTQQLNAGTVKLLMGEAEGVRLSVHERSLIQSRFKEAVEYLNKEMSKSGPKVEYIP